MNRTNLSTRLPLLRQLGDWKPEGMDKRVAFLPNRPI